MGTHLLTPPESGFVDPRLNSRGDTASHRSRGTLTGLAIFTCNGAGSSTTGVGAAASITASTNIPRIGERFKIHNSTGKEKSSTVHTVTAHNGTTTVTFTPAAPVATASGDTFRLVSDDPFTDNESLDIALLQRGYTQFRVNQMTQNDKVFALRVFDDPQGI